MLGFPWFAHGSRDLELFRRDCEATRTCNLRSQRARGLKTIKENPYREVGPPTEVTGDVTSVHSWNYI
jgi:hypothetical protein